MMVSANIACARARMLRSVISEKVSSITPGFVPMPTMKAMQVCLPGGEFELVQREIPEPEEHEVLIKVEACGICHGDSLAKEGGFPGLSLPASPGPQGSRNDRE